MRLVYCKFTLGLLLLKCGKVVSVVFFICEHFKGTYGGVHFFIYYLMLYVCMCVCLFVIRKAKSHLIQITPNSHKRSMTACDGYDMLSC